MHLNVAWKTPQFWLLWWVLCLNVTAGIGVIGMASPMLQEVFAGQLIGLDVKFGDLTSEQLKQIAAIAAGFPRPPSLFNIAGRFIWASASDYLGRKLTYATFFLLGIALYASAPWSGHAHHIALFVGAFCIILSMYGGGFATVPAYLADMFGTQMVGAIHGRLLTAWSAAGIFGPVIVNYLREYQLAQGIPRAAVYDTTLYILCGLLAVGLVCNLLVRPVADRYYMTDAELEAERRIAHEAAARAAGDPNSAANAASDVKPTSSALVALCWLGSRPAAGVGCVHDDQQGGGTVPLAGPRVAGDEPAEVRQRGYADAPVRRCPAASRAAT